MTRAWTRIWRRVLSRQVRQRLTCRILRKILRWNWLRSLTKKLGLQFDLLKPQAWSVWGFVYSLDSGCLAEMYYVGQVYSLYRAYFKESLQLQKFLISEKFHWPKFLTTFFLFLVISSIPYISSIQNAASSLQLHSQFLLTFIASLILKISRFSVFHPSFTLFFTSKFTTTTAQFTVYNCKLHFTTAEIVISCTLKYALGHNYTYILTYNSELSYCVANGNHNEKFGHFLRT